MNKWKRGAGCRILSVLAAVLLCVICPMLSVGAESSEDSQASQTVQQSGAAEDTANELYNDGQMNLDVVFVLDASGSMINSDPSKVALDAYRLFVDLLDDTCGIGYVVYTHKLLATSDVVDISDTKALEKTKKEMAEVKYDLDGYTDIALGLTKAKEMLTTPEIKKDHREKVIILLTDGNTALPKEGARTLQKSEDEMDATLLALHDYQIPVYTIGLNYNGRMKKEEVQRIAEETDGVWYETTTSEKLVEIFSDIFGNIYELNGEKKEIVDGEVKIAVNDDTVFTVSVIIRSPFTFKELNPQLKDPAQKVVPLDKNEQVSVSSTGSYTMLKLFYPDAGEWSLHLDKANNDNCTVTQMDYYSVYLEQKTQTTFSTGKAMTIETTVKNAEGILQDKKLLNTFTVKANIKNASGKETVKLMKSDAAGVYYCEWEPEAVGEYVITTVAETPKFKKTSQSDKVKILTPEEYAEYLKGQGRADEIEKDGHKDSGNAWFAVIIIAASVVISVVLIIVIVVVVRGAKKVVPMVEPMADEPVEAKPNPTVQHQQKTAKESDMSPATPPKLVDYEIVEHDELEKLIKKGPEDAFNANADQYQTDAALEALIRKGPDTSFGVGTGGQQKLPEEMDDEDGEYDDDEYEDYDDDDEGGLDEEYEDDYDDDDDDDGGPLAGLNIRKD